MQVKQKDLESFLKLGYFLSYENPTLSFDFSTINIQKHGKMDMDELITLGSDLYMNSINKRFKHDEKHVVPLSGGLDSRAILAGLLEFTPASNIITYTFGTPGTLDYDLGNKISKEIGTNHTNFPLLDYVYSMDELLDISNRIDHQTVLFHHPPVWMIDQMFEGSRIWSGFFGGELTGAKYIEKTNLVQAKQKFLKKNCYQNIIRLNQCPEDILYKQLTFYENDYLTNFEILDYYNRQLKFVAPHVLMKGYKYSLPFLDEDLLGFFGSIQDEYKTDQLLIKKILLNKFPELFSYGVKNNMGLSLKAPKPLVLLNRIYLKVNRLLNPRLNKHINYLDFDTAIREKNDLKEIIRMNVNDLYNRKIIDWIDIRKIYKEHISCKGEYGKALILLASLEIHIKAQE